MKATEREHTRAKQFRINMTEAPGENKEGEEHTEGGVTENLIERKLLVAFSCEIEHVPRTDVHHSSGSPQGTLH